MRNKPTKERKRERAEIAYKYRHEITILSKTGTHREIKNFVDTYIRPELCYSLHTYSWDIYMSLSIMLKRKIIQDGKDGNSMD